MSVDDAAVAVGSALTRQLVAAKSGYATNDDYSQSVLPNAVDAATGDHEPACCTPIGRFYKAPNCKNLTLIFSNTILI